MLESFCGEVESRVTTSRLLATRLLARRLLALRPLASRPLTSRPPASFDLVQRLEQGPAGGPGGDRRDQSCLHGKDEIAGRPQRECSEQRGKLVSDGGA